MTPRPEQRITPAHDSSAPLFSTCPAGEHFPLPEPADYDHALKRLQKLVNEQRLLDRDIVVVMGVGFVGAVMGGVVADSVDRTTGESTKFVIGMQRPSPRSYWKIRYLNCGPELNLRRSSGASQARRQDRQFTVPLCGLQIRK